MTEPPALIAVDRLRTALEAVASALSRADTTALVNAETGLQSALAAFGAVGEVPPRDRPSVAWEIGRARAALARCRLLGRSPAEVLRATLAARGLDPGYDRSGGTPPGPAPRGGALKARL